LPAIEPADPAFVLALGGLEIHSKVYPKAARKLAQHRGGAALQGKLVAEGGKLNLLDVGFTWVDPKPEAGGRWRAVSAPIAPPTSARDPLRRDPATGATAHSPRPPVRPEEPFGVAAGQDHDPARRIASWPLPEVPAAAREVLELAGA
jgi:hypothetical protein